MEKRHQISRIISRIVLNMATEEEKRTIREWLDESPEHQREYKNWMKRLPKDLAAGNSIDPQIAWNEFRKKLPSKRSPIRLIRYGAAAAILLGLLYTGALYMQKESPREETVARILPGTAKSVLQLENGEDVSLEAHTVLLPVAGTGISSYKNENGVLHYDIEASLGPSPSAGSLTHTLKVPRGGEYQLILADGTHIYLNSDTKIKYPVAFMDSIREVYISGEAYFNVAHDASKPFVVHTQSGTVSVLGTKFNVHAYDDEPQSLVTLVEGSVAYTVGGDVTLLKPGIQAVYRKSSRSVSTSQVDTSTYISWIDGMFEFDSMPLELIMKQLARWYDVDYTFRNKELESHRFTGIAYRQNTLKELLLQIEKTTQIKFEIKNRMIVIHN